MCYEIGLTRAKGRSDRLLKRTDSHEIPMKAHNPMNACPRGILSCQEHFGLF